MLLTPQCLFIGVGKRDQSVFKVAANSLFDHIDLKFCDSNFAALNWVAENQPDLVVVDDRQFDFSADPIIRKLLKHPHCADSAVLVTLDASRYTDHIRMTHTGAIDYIRQPLIYPELLQRLRILFSLIESQRLANTSVKADTNLVSLETLQSVSNQTYMDHCYERETLMRLAKAGEYRDEVTGAHVARIGLFSRQIAEALGLSQAECDLIEQAAPLHDIGKIGIPDKLLLKPGRYTDEEREDMKSHTTIGYEILKDSPSKYLQMGAEIALSHHEKFDGSGYPYALKGEEIPLSARIVAVADVYDALTSTRPYKNAVEKALNFLEQYKGSYFDPDCVSAFVEDASLKISF
jgi:two-component system response regulator RpfG